MTNHRCLFAFLCKEFSDLDLEWDFFERIRTRRNGAHYYGERITYETWQEVAVGMRLYATTLKKAAERKIS